jgi:hypothetical protein
MARPSYPPVPARKAVLDEIAKVAKLREQRLAKDVASREAGTWGDLSVGQLTHEPTGEMFVLVWKGRIRPDLATLHRIRFPELSIAEHERLRSWVAGCDEEEFKHSFVGWNLSRSEARRTMKARIAELRAIGHSVINDLHVAA